MAEDSQELFVVIRRGYDTKLILPFESGISFIKLLNRSFVLKEEYGKEKKVVPALDEDFSFEVMSESKINEIKLGSMINAD